jgi:hypothetical protein
VRCPYLVRELCHTNAPPHHQSSTKGLFAADNRENANAGIAISLSNTKTSHTK